MPRRDRASDPARFLRLLFAFLVALIMGIRSTGASQIVPLNLEELTIHAATIFSGRCVDVRVEEDPSTGRRTTLVTFAVTRRVKGPTHGRFTIRMLGDATAGAEQGRRIDGLPAFERGEQVVLFLYGESRSGLTSPVGFGQGKFAVVKDKDGRSRAVNAFGNKDLFQRLTPEAERRIGVEAARGKERGGISPEALLDMTEALVR